MSDPFYFFGYFIAMCIGVRYMAQNRSYIGVKVSHRLRCVLLIISFEESRISIFAVLSQMYLYAALTFFIATNVLPLEIIAKTDSLNVLLGWICLFHFVILFLTGMVESSICEWKHGQRL